jgi:hypothetical protein
MIEHCYSRTSVITRLRRGLLGPYLDDLATALHQQGYARDSIRHSLHACEQCGQWLSQQGYATQEVDEALVERYRCGLPRPPSGRQPKATEGLSPLLRLLRQRGIVSALTPVPSSTAGDHWLRRYEYDLDHVRGAAVTTRQSYLPVAKRFLDACGRSGQVDWGAVRAQGSGPCSERIIAEPEKPVVYPSSIIKELHTSADRVVPVSLQRIS